MSYHYDSSKYKTWSWMHPYMLHWMINPGLVVNELILGQRIPKRMLIENSKTKTLSERTFVPCPHCHAIHSGMKWSGQNKTATKNWFGLYCDRCGKIIPCLMNITSLAVLIITFPIWIWFKDSLKERWLAKQPARYSNIDLTQSNNPFQGSGWIREGFSWGTFMFIVMFSLGVTLFEEPFTWQHMLRTYISWTVAGIVFGYVSKRLLSKPKPQPQR